MSGGNLNAILEHCLERIAGGDSVEQCLAEYPQHADRLKPLLEVAHDLNQLPRVRPRPTADIAIQQQLKQRMLPNANHPPSPSWQGKFLTRPARWEKEPTIMKIFSRSLQSLLPRSLAMVAIIIVIVFAIAIIPNMTGPDPDQDTALQAPLTVTEPPVTSTMEATSQPTATAVPTQPATSEPTVETAATAIPPTAVQPGKFAIYLAAGGIPITPNLTLSQIELAGEPLIDSDDIITYESETHLVELTTAASQRLTDLNLPGNLFVVTVGQERVYYGGFMAAYMSRSYDGVVILWPPITRDDLKMEIQLGYPGSDFFIGEDPRSDPRIMDALRQAGKLR